MENSLLFIKILSDKSNPKSPRSDELGIEASIWYLNFEDCDCGLIETERMQLKTNMN
ncbi:MAG: hypothetical protein Q8933_11330 [Bacteroidota bacterium]|nr:hypothetical protein [Bacteroidota bacterium]MDP4197382.1 hypothetical protein [Bacteroidota bacterium]